jgi:hypothetical protein
MTATERVRRTRRLLRAAEIGRAMLEGMAVVLAVAVLASMVDGRVALPGALRMALVPLALLLGCVTVLARMRLESTRDDQEAALWIEQRFPSLRYALVTVLDPRYAGAHPVLEQAVQATPFEPVARAAAWRAVVRPLVAVLVLGAVVLALPAGALARVATPRAGDLLARRVAAPVADPLARIVARVMPPAYAQGAVSTLEDPATIRALVGSGVTVQGRDGPEPVTATVGDSVRRAIDADGRWTIALAMPAAPTAVRLGSGAHQRLLVLEPVADTAPVVTLNTPARDSIFRRPVGSLALSADLTDDIGLASGAFEYVVSSGSGESFTFKSGTIGAATFTSRRGSLSGTLSLDALALRPGDLVHLRAVARDRNDVTGPGLGASETRTLRIARADEYDSVAVDAAPPPEPEKNALSQRMILMLTEALEKKRPSLTRADVVRESRTISEDQTRLRKRVGQIVFQRLGESEGEEGDAADKRLEKPVNADSVLAAAERATNVDNSKPLEGNEDETPVVAINKPLLEAYNHMWNAGTELELGEPGKAIPWMRKALAALQRARSAERIYLRGATKPVIVDVARVRLSGKETGAPSVRDPRAALDPQRLARLARFDAALAVIARAPAAAADSLLLLRLDLVDGQGDVARALSSAADALRSATGGRDATDALIRARRALAGGLVRRRGLSAWSGQ